jgi:hypothetical protein
MKTILFALIAASSLSACVVQPARVKLRSPIVLEPVVVEPVYDDHSSRWRLLPAGAGQERPLLRL